MGQEKFRGVVPPVVVPLKADRSLDVESYERTINRMIDAGVDGLFFLGSSGGVAFASDAEREEIMEHASRIVDGRVPVMAGVIDIETNRVIDQIRRMEKFDVDAIVATAPFYALSSHKEVERHFRLIRECTDLPLYAYDLPVSVHKKLDRDMLVNLGREGILQGVKDSSGDDVSFRLLMLANEDAGHPLQIFTGHEVVVDGAYLGGADGSVPGLANVYPEGYVEQWKAALAHDWDKVSSIQDQLASLMLITNDVSATEGFGAGVGAFKTALWQLGVFNTNQMREPVQALEGQDVENIAKVLRNQGMLGKDAPTKKDWK